MSEEKFMGTQFYGEGLIVEEVSLLLHDRHGQIKP
jgi:hypothetical protein